MNAEAHAANRSNAAAPVNQGALVTSDGDVLRFTVNGATYVCKGHAAEIIKRHRATYDGDERAAAAFFHGVLVTLTLAVELSSEKEEANGEKR